LLLSLSLFPIALNLSIAKFPLVIDQATFQTEAAAAAAAAATTTATAARRWSCCCCCRCRIPDDNCLWARFLILVLALAVLLFLLLDVRDVRVRVLKKVF
jgi:hypothetical protein